MPCKRRDCSPILLWGGPPSPLMLCVSENLPYFAMCLKRRLFLPQTSRPCMRFRFSLKQKVLPCNYLKNYILSQNAQKQKRFLSGVLWLPAPKEARDSFISGLWGNTFQAG